MSELKPFHLGSRVVDVTGHAGFVVGCTGELVTFLEDEPWRFHYSDGHPMGSSSMRRTMMHESTELENADLGRYEPISREAWESVIPVGFEKYRHALNDTLRAKVTP